ncbi:ABC-F family ATP-binding cassette domain-containing protein [Shouchella clausii]|uniref:ABC-F family ATP-binding cassette domain-containing protein n=1 Tax=Shouchella clausii TaxID=79880 RepID=UPI000BA7D290|nr:ABC-F family ATP-binding cassette domain-containing protein [Shouchella clausii]MBU8597909.1 ABC-F family ATP-binding cassette domain-containing protein [Shouchella clausii]MEB5481592.1 ABC-F family ATP-binding cassette domain-containing protein [Shouchella clausii]PAD08132.1 multidrug ABC transporter ATP-binding protein [Shouchella clausii]PAD12042.1 multidrug ABC transporter ATP-binding protein [Shouchella clausii]PAD91249.1 multidrug ABC transporter ATP-binding protein [Shouchella clausi
MSLLRAEGLTKSFGDKICFESIHFSLEKGDRIGLLGVNGTGKSTLLKGLAGVEGFDAGALFHANEFTLEYLPQQLDMPENETAIRYIYKSESTLMRTVASYEKALQDLEAHPHDNKRQAELLKWQEEMDRVDAWEAATQAKTILSKLGVSALSAKLGTLSGGQKKRVALARALIQPADLLLLDEPTNHLDHATVEWLEEHLKQYPGALIVITHDRYFLNRVANTIFELSEGALYRYVGNFETYLEEKAERKAQAEQAEDKRKNLLRRELAWLKRGAKARTTKQKARIQRVEALNAQTGPSDNRQLDMPIGHKRLGKQVIELRQVSKSYQGKLLFSDLSFLMGKNERLGIIGENGSGKTTLLNMMAGRTAPDSGTVDVGETVRIGYYRQEDAELDGDLRVVEYIKEVAEVVYTTKGDAIYAEQMLERFLFPRSQQWTYIRRLSGGEKRRLYLLRVLMGEPNVLFLDEPTNDLDVETLAVLEDYLDTFPGAVVAVSHDRYFLDRVVDRMLIFEGNRLLRYDGDYSDYIAGRNDIPAKQPQHEQPPTPQPKKEQKKLSYNEQREWEQIDGHIAALEEKQQILEQAIADAGSDYGRIADLLKEKEMLDSELEAALNRWTELAEKIEALQSK